VEADGRVDYLRWMQPTMERLRVVRRVCEVTSLPEFAGCEVVADATGVGMPGGRDAAGRQFEGVDCAGDAGGVEFQQGRLRLPGRSALAGRLRGVRGSGHEGFREIVSLEAVQGSQYGPGQGEEPELLAGGGIGCLILDGISVAHAS
jgi:hypothetical protein